MIAPWTPAARFLLKRTWSSVTLTAGLSSATIAIPPPKPLPAGKSRALILAGLPGDEEHEQHFGSIAQQWRCLDWLADSARAGLLHVDREPLDFRGIEKLARKYADQPMDFADASVVLLAIRSGVREILTADRRDFAVYRLPGKARFIDVLASA